MIKATRRQFLSTVAVGTAIIPISAILLSRPGRAQDVEKLDENDPQAESLNYTHQSDKAYQMCKECQFFQGDPEAEWGPCSIFQGKAVSANGWCRSWFARAV